MTQIDRRTFLSGAGAGGLSLLGMDAAASAARQLRSICPPGPPIPRRLQDAIRGRVFRRGSPGFSEAARIFNKNFDNVVPRLVARPVDTRDVRAALRWAIRHDVPFRARSGGHSYAGYSVLGGDGLVIDLRQLRQISVDRRAGTVTVGAGAQLIDVHAALARHGGAVPGGSCPSVGIAGAALGGGQGLTGRKFGLTSDNLIEAEIITADGCVQRVNRRTDPDLLWALRGGGGGNFGIVTRFTFRVRRVPSRAAYFNVRWPWSSANQAIDAWQRWAPRTNDGLTCILHLDAGGGGASINTSGQYLGPAGDLGRLLRPLLSVPGARVSTATYDYFTLQLIWAGCRHIGLLGCHNVGTRPGGALPRERFQAKSDYVTRPLSAAGRSAAINAIQGLARSRGGGALLFDAYGGELNRPAPHATAFVHRDSLFCIQYFTESAGAWLRQTHSAMRPYVSGQAYQNYIDRELNDWRRAYYGANYRRLVEVRKRVDPEHRFNFPQAIGR
jgi:FAD/FMN-containing dehydrogenase